METNKPLVVFGNDSNGYYFEFTIMPRQIKFTLLKTRKDIDYSMEIALFSDTRQITLSHILKNVGKAYDDNELIGKYLSLYDYCVRGVVDENIEEDDTTIQLKMPNFDVTIK
jgi:hypothetical protein